MYAGRSNSLISSSAWRLEPQTPTIEPRLDGAFPNLCNTTNSIVARKLKGTLRKNFLRMSTKAILGEETRVLREL
jgi:hypothetical protein